MQFLPGRLMSNLLRPTQQQFALLAARLILRADELGYGVTLADAYRDPRVFGAMGVRQGYGESRSAHKQRLALDLNLFRGPKYLTRTADHAELGKWWEQQRPDCVWGGRFNDGNHYSIMYGGIA